MRSLVVISAAAVFISGCAVFPDKTLEYQKAETIDKMEVPEGMTFSGEDERYPIVKEDERLQHKPKRKDRFKAPEPPQLITLDEDGEQEEPATEEPTNLKPMLGRDGNGYPILMLNTSFSWAWEYVTRAVENMELSVLDVNRSAGVVYVSLPKKKYDLKDRRAQLKLSNTVNGVQVSALDRLGESMLKEDIGRDVLTQLREQL